MIKGLKIGSKFQFVSSFTATLRYHNNELTYPSGLVVSLVNLTVNSNGVTAQFKVLRSSAIITNYYNDIDPKFYDPDSKWKTWNMLHLEGDQVDDFFERVETGSILRFDKEYSRLQKIRR